MTMLIKNEICILVISLTVNPLLSCNDAMQLSYTASKSILTMKCKIVDYACCTDSNVMEFFKNDVGVCSVSDCSGKQDSPRNIDDTIFYRCGCSSQNIRNVFFLTTEMRESDIGKWQCRSRNKSGDLECQSNVINVEMSKEGAEIHMYFILTVVTLLVLTMVVFAGIIVAVWRFKRRDKGTNSSLEGQNLVGVRDRGMKENEA